jgi:hypothetical protein
MSRSCVRLSHKTIRAYTTIILDSPNPGRNMACTTATPSPTIDPIPHMPWVLGIAKTVAVHYHIANRADIDDLNSAGTIALLNQIRLFNRWDTEDLEGAFRGFAHRHIKTACQREAERLINGGTYHTRRRVQGEQPLIARRFADIDDEMESDGPYEPSDEIHNLRFRYL